MHGAFTRRFRTRQWPFFSCILLGNSRLYSPSLFRLFLLFSLFSSYQNTDLFSHLISPRDLNNMRLLVLGCLVGNQLR
jgi:hypothetical protein